MRRRKYELKRRAERQEGTRRRIARATLELHETVGPSQTTISAIAERAGVGRPTVYSHFPDELSLFKACSSLDLAENPLPDPDVWAKIPDPEERLSSALSELYDYFRRKEGLWTNITRDGEMPQIKANPAAREIMEPFFAHWGRMQQVLVAGWEEHEGSTPLLSGAVGLALDFQTWRTLVRRQGLDDAGAIGLMVCAARCAARGCDDPAR